MASWFPDYFTFYHERGMRFYRKPHRGVMELIFYSRIRAPIFKILLKKVRSRFSFYRQCIWVSYVYELGKWTRRVFPSPSALKFILSFTFLKINPSLLLKYCHSLIWLNITFFKEISYYWGGVYLSFQGLNGFHFWSNSIKFIRITRCNGCILFFVNG